MLSPGYFDFRWSWYRPILNRGEAISTRCRVDVHRLPVRFVGEDGKTRIPYALHSSLLQVAQTAMRRLQEYSVRYMIDGEKISAHQLPKMNPVARMMVQHLRKRYPHLPQMLLHHWCADEKGGLALFGMWQDMWAQSWKQDQLDNAPWVASVNVLMLKLIREAIAQLPREHEAHMDHVMVSVAGGLYDWALRNFLKQHVDGGVEVTRIATYEAMTIPVTAISFLFRQPDDSLLSDDRFVIMSYGLDADIVPRMRALRAKVEAKHEAGILPLLARDKMGEHLLRRSWVRLALWELAEKTGQGVWMQWVLNAKKLDKLIARPESLPDAALKLLAVSSDHPLAAWVIARCNPKKAKAADAAQPWLKDDRVLDAFRVFEEDVGVECARRKSEKTWLDRSKELTGKSRGAEGDKALHAAWTAGELVYFQSAEQSLHSGSSLSSKQICMRIDWSDYLANMAAKHTDFSKFLEGTLLPGVLAKVSQSQQVFLDEMSASGCLLRGAVEPLMMLATAIREQLKQYYLDVIEGDGKGRIITASICMTMSGDWTVVEHKHKSLGKFRLASGVSVAQADAGVAHDAGLGQIITWRDHRAGKKALGTVRVDELDAGTGQTATVLFNQGLALTEAVVTEFVSQSSAKARVKNFYLDQQKAGVIFSKYRLLGDSFEFTAVIPHDGDEDMMLFVKVGMVNLQASPTHIYELLDPNSEAAQVIRSEILMSWLG